MGLDELPERLRADALVGAVIAAASEVVDAGLSDGPSMRRLKAALEALERHTNEKVAESIWKAKRRGKR